MTEPLLLGLDVGTSAVKAALIDLSGAEVAHGRAPTPWRRVATGAEIAPDELVAAALDAATRSLRGAPDGRVVGVGVASMAETGVLLDARGRPAVPSIAWHDSRGVDEARDLARELGSSEFAARTGLPASSLCTLCKYRWMCANWPDAAQGVRWLNVAEWIVRGLGGEEGSESSLASRTGFYDLHARAPWGAALDWAGAPPGLAMEHAPAGTPLGHVSAPGLTAARGAVLAVGGHDHLAAAVGAGAAGEGDVLDSCGTAEAWVRASAPLSRDSVAQAVARGIEVGWHALEGRQALLGSMRSGAVLRTVLDLLGVPVEEREALETAALAADPGEIDLDGLGDDVLTVTGIRAGGSPAVLYRAALEAVGRRGAQVLEHMDAIAGPRRRLVVTGGWAAGAAARAVKARHLGAFEHTAAISTGARGAALAAGRAAGLWSIDDMPAHRGRAEPAPAP